MEVLSQKFKLLARKNVMPQSMLLSEHFLNGQRPLPDIAQKYYVKHLKLWFQKQIN